MGDNRDGEEHTVSQFDRNNHVFQEEYQYWRRQRNAEGKPLHSHVVAYNRAADYYRKFTAHESTQNWQQAVDREHHDTQAEDMVERIQFNQVVATMLGKLTARQKELLCYVVVQQDLDQYLDEENLRVVRGIVKKKRPEDVKDIAKAMKLNLSKVGVCTPITKMRQRIRESFRQQGFTLEEQ
jgi:hypothetical protein